MLMAFGPIPQSDTMIDFALKFCNAAMPVMSESPQKTSLLWRCLQDFTYSVPLSRLHARTNAKEVAWAELEEDGEVDVLHDFEGSLRTVCEQQRK